jgi:hypothetical protein
MIGIKPNRSKDRLEIEWLFVCWKQDGQVISTLWSLEGPKILDVSTIR